MYHIWRTYRAISVNTAVQHGKWRNCTKFRVCYLYLLKRTSCLLFVISIKVLKILTRFLGSQTCKGLKLSGRTVDGEYNIYINRSCDRPVKVYCHGMNTTTPKAFITLTAGADQNYGMVYSKQLPQEPYQMRYLCTGLPSRKTIPEAGKTRFSKVRIDLKKMRLIRNDFTFSTSDRTGKQIEFGYAGDCWSMNYGPCRRGHFKINLSGTGLRINPTVRWQQVGSPPGVAMREFVRSKDGTVVSAKCGGRCGFCQPTADLLVEQQVCNQIPGEFGLIYLSLIQ